ncbi:pilin [Nocardiopsis nanhaiensis]
MEATKKSTRPALLLPLMAIAGAALVLGDPSPVWAQEGEEPGVSDLDSVITNIRNWLVGLLVVLATLLLTIGGLRYLLAGGDPGEVNKAKDTLKYSALGYLVAILAPVLVQILRGFVGLQ